MISPLPGSDRLRGLRTLLMTAVLAGCSAAGSHTEPTTIQPASANTRAMVQFQDYDFSRYSQEITQCDRLAAHGRDPGSVAPPVTRASMDKAAAIEACTAAVAADPANPRLNYQLGRAFGYSGRGEEAMPYRLKALEADYPQSLFVIGYLYLIGVTIEQDICQAQRLWRKAAGYKRLAALVALPRHEMRGDFSSCGLVLPPAELRAYLQQARRESDDFYVGMLVEDMLGELDANADQ